jgi:tetratricopeptide (TPR) repeat protein
MTRGVTIVLIGLAAIVVAIVGLGWWWRRTAAPQYSAADLQLFGSLRVTGVALLENDQPQQSIDAFVRLASTFPDQPLGPRNLAVARLMILQSLDRGSEADRWQDAYQQAEQAVVALQKIDPHADVSHILAARVAAAAAQTAVAAEHYQTALQLAPPSARAPIWFEWYRLAQLSRSEDQRMVARDLIREAVLSAPRNSGALIEWLMMQAEQRDPAIRETIEQTRDVLAPLDARIQQYVRVSLLELFDQARQAAEAEDWDAINRSVRMIVNVTRPEELVRSDIRQLDRNVLEFVIVDFPDAFYQQHQLQRVVPAESITVEFVDDQSVFLPAHSGILNFATGDFNLNGLPDLIILTEQQLQVWSRAAVGEPWTILTSLDLDKSYHSLLIADLDADSMVGGAADGSLAHTADLDLVLFGNDGWTILENRLEADGERRLVVQEIGSNTAEVYTAMVGDFDLDGDLDLFVSSESGISVWANLGNLRFEPWDADALIGVENLRPRQVIAVDWDRDFDLDIVVAAAGGQPAGYLENLRHSQMRWRPFDETFAIPVTANRLAIDDVDGNASWDLISCGEDGCGVTKTQTPESGRIAVHATGVITQSFTRILDQIDYDNDGLLDLLVEQAGKPLLLRHLGYGQYQPQAQLLPEDLPQIAAAMSVDIDRDGDLDLLILDDGQLRVLTNNGGNANNWVEVVLLAQQVKGADAQASGRVNQYGYGSLLELKQGASYRSRVVHAPATHLGLGEHEQADVIRVVWTNGVPQNIIRPNSNQTVTERQTLKGSCPYLYAWSGDGFTFVTDLLWAAPLGLQLADGTIAPDRPWEYLKIDGDAMTPIDGEYRLQITEELWEVAYFDHVALIAVDHPENVEVFTNEKVGPPALAQPGMHVVSQRRPPVAATDSQGRDVLNLISSQDDRYLKAYEQKFCQGYVSDHYVEIDLGQLDSSNQLTLFLNGWIYPTDTSLNTQLAQDPTRSGPRPPYLMVPDGVGQWREAKDFIGFPGGKTKTIAVDISDVEFAGDDYRLRICTSAEIYWDAIFLSSDPPEVALIEQPLPLLSADLHYRGVSRRVEHPENGPERYDYDDVSQVPAWPEVEGNFTRFGDVTELLRDVDDRLVVMGSGDEMTLRFAVPPEPLKQGWKRDFVLHCWGWDKDGDLNTVYGETVEPLPFQAMESYPVPADAARPDSKQYLQYLHRYQTRQQSSGRFRNTVRDFEQHHKY